MYKSLAPSRLLLLAITGSPIPMFLGDTTEGNLFLVGSKVSQVCAETVLFEHPDLPQVAACFCGKGRCGTRVQEGL